MRTATSTAAARPRPPRAVVSRPWSNPGLLALVAIVGSACGLARAPTTPMAFAFDHAPTHAAPCLLVLLPGIGDSVADLIDRGMVAMVRERGIAADVLVVDAHFGYYRTRSTASRLWQDALLPRIADYEQVWLAGVSLGGFGALLTASDVEIAEHPPVTGILAVSPYLGGDAVAESVTRAGGLPSWRPPNADGSIGERVFAWLSGYADPTAARPELYLGIGSADHLVQQVRAAATALPSSHVVEVPGDHEWPTFLAVWGQLLDRAPLPRAR